MSIVTSSEFQRNVALYQDKARTEPVTIIADGKESRVTSISTPN